MRWVCLVLSHLVLTQVPFSATIRVPGDQTTIQSAIDLAVGGDTVLVSSGTYVENIEILAKNIRVIAESGPQTTVIKSPVDDPALRASVQVSAPLRGMGKEVEKDIFYPSVDPVVYITGGCDTTLLIQGFTIDGRGVALGLYCSYADLEMCDCIVENGYGEVYGGGMCFVLSAPYLHDNVIRNNESYVVGGGVYLWSMDGGGTSRILNNVFHDNYAGACPGLMIDYGENVVVERNIFSSNYAQHEQFPIEQGALYAAYADYVSIRNNTFCGNTAGMVFLMGSEIDVRNNIVCNNVEEGIRIRDDAPMPSNFTCDYNDVYNNNSDYIGSGQPGDSCISADPLFEHSYPGRFYLTPDSPCRDAGDPDPVYNDPDGGRNDIGAVYYVEHESQSPITRRVPSEYPSIQAAVESCNYGDTVLVAAGTYSEHVGINGKSVVIISESGAEATMITAPPGDYAKYAQGVITLGGGCDSTTVFSGFTVDGQDKTPCFVCINSSGEISNCIIQHGSNSEAGGGIFGVDAPILIKNNYIRWNYAPGSGGGIYIEMNKPTRGVWIIGNDIYENYSDNGPGISLAQADSSHVERNILYRNEANVISDHRGAIDIDIGYDIHIIGNTVEGNLCGITVMTSHPHYVYNNLVCNNATGGIWSESYGHQQYHDYNLVWNNGGYDYLAGSPPGEHDICADPLLEDCYLRDGYYLSPVSPCIDAGNPSDIYNDPDGSRNDIGAVPYTPVDPCPGPVVMMVPSQYSSIQEAIDESKFGDTIIVAAGTYEENLHLEGRTVSIISAVGPEGTILRPSSVKQADELIQRRRFRISPDSLNILHYLPQDMTDKFINSSEIRLGPDPPPVIYVGLGSLEGTTISGFTIDGQNKVKGVYCLGSDIDLTDCIIQNCQGSYGGALSFDYSSPVITGNIIRNSFAIYFGGAIAVVLKNGPRTAYIGGNSMHDNEAQFVPGAAIVQGGHVLVERNRIFRNITLIENDDDIRHGLYFYECTDADVVNNTIDHNTGGILFWNSDSLTMFNNIISNNLYVGLEERGEVPADRGLDHDYNDVWNNGIDDYSGLASPSPNEMSADPRFVPHLHDEFYLADGSPCIDAGHPDPQYNDPDGSRNDIGAVPYQAVGPYEPKTIYVPTDFETIQAAIDAAAFGDTIMVAEGTYNELVDFKGRSVALLSEAGREHTTIRTPDTLAKSTAYFKTTLDPESSRDPENDAGDLRGSLILPSVVYIGPGCDSTTVINGFTIDGDSKILGMRIIGSDAEVSDCIIENCYNFYFGGGLYVENGAPLVKGNDIRYNRSDEWGAGVYAQLGSYSGTARFIENRIHGNFGHSAPGLTLHSGEGAVVSRNLIFDNFQVYNTGLAALYVAAANVEILNNVVAGNEAGIRCYNAAKVNIYNNIVIDNYTVGIYVGDESGVSDEIAIDYNDVWNNIEFDYHMLAEPGAHAISADPLFNPYYADEFYLSAGSPCIDSGNPDPQYNDPDGSRNDIGAVPYLDISPPPLPQIRHVPGEYFTIQEAIDEANYGDTIMVAAGIYEGRLHIGGKSIILVSADGPENTIISPLYSDAGLQVSALAGGEPSGGDRGEEWFDSAAVISVGPYNDTTTVIDGFTINGDGVFKGIWGNLSDITIRNCIIEYCYGYYGGGIGLSACRPLIEDNILRFNCSGYHGYGAAIYHDQGDRPQYRATDELKAGETCRIIGNRIYGNRGVNPGIFIRNGNGGLIAGNVIAGNFAPVEDSNYHFGQRMAVIRIRDFPNTVICNNTIDNNTYGIYRDDSFTSGLVVENNIITNNWLGGFYSSSTFYLLYCDVWNNGLADYWGAALPSTGTISADPLFNLNGGVEYLLSDTSPCIDAGNPDSQYNDPDGSRNDMGANPYFWTEPHSPITIQVPAEYSSIQEAINAAGYGDTILVSPGVYDENLDLAGRSLVVKSESGAEQTLIRGHQQKALRMLQDSPRSAIDDSPEKDSRGYRLSTSAALYIFPPADSTTVISGFTFDGGGYVTGVRCIGTDATIHDCIFEDGFDYGAGGGLYFDGSGPLIENNIFRRNFTPGGAGLCGQLVTNHGWARIKGNTFTDNTGYSGIAILLRGGAEGIIDHNIVYENSLNEDPLWGYVEAVSSICMRGTRDIQLHNNTIVSNDFGLTAIEAGDIDVRNNIIAYNGYQGFQIWSYPDFDPCWNIIIDYNDIYANDNDYLGPVTLGANNLSVTPGFDYDYPNQYRLKAGSACIDAADPDPQYEDEDGSRGDIGAVPYSGKPIMRYVPEDYSTIQAAIDASYYNDTVYVSSGVYEELISFNGKTIVLMSSGGEWAARLEYPAGQASSRPPQDAYSMGGQKVPEAIISVDSSSRGGCIIQGLTIDGGNQVRAIQCLGAKVKVRWCTIENGMTWANGGGMDFEQCSPLVDENIIRNCFAGISGAGIYVEPGDDGDTAVISGNEIYNNTGADNPGIALIDGSDAIVTRNTIYDNITISSLVDRGAIYIKTNNSRVLNNTLDNNSIGIVVDTVGGIDLRNNIIVNHRSGGIEFVMLKKSGLLPVGDYNNVWNNAGNDYLGQATPGAHDISADPIFVSLPGDYRLEENSPCIDAGDPDTVYNDPDGSRNDMGAFPYISEICGDANGDGWINVGDPVFLINYIFKGDSAPNPLCVGDADGDDAVNIGDAVYLINYIFKSGPDPVADCCP